MEWRPVPNHPGYEVSSQGDARYNGEPLRITRKINGRRLRYFTARNMKLADGKLATGCRPQVFVSTAVLEAFAGKPEYVCDTWHINGDSSDDRLENLIWIARGEFQKRRKAAVK